MSCERRPAMRVLGPLGLPLQRPGHTPALGVPDGRSSGPGVPGAQPLVRPSPAPRVRTRPACPPALLTRGHPVSKGFKSTHSRPPLRRLESHTFLLVRKEHRDHRRLTSTRNHPAAANAVPPRHTGTPSREFLRRWARALPEVQSQLVKQLLPI